jgi:hypothetical protein
MIGELGDEGLFARLVCNCEGEVEAGVDFSQQVTKLGFLHEDEWFGRGRLQIPEIVEVPFTVPEFALSKELCGNVLCDLLV